MERGTPMSNSEARKAQRFGASNPCEPKCHGYGIGCGCNPRPTAADHASDRAAGELVADVDTLAVAIRNAVGFRTSARELAEALVAAGFGRIDAARREIEAAERRGAERGWDRALVQASGNGYLVAGYLVMVQSNPYRGATS